MKQRLPLIFFILGILAAGGLGALIIMQAPNTPLIALALLLLLLAVFGLTGPVWIQLFRKILPAEHQAQTLSMGARFGLWTAIFAVALVSLKLFGFLERFFVLIILGMIMLLEMLIQQNQKQTRPHTRKPKHR